MSMTIAERLLLIISQDSKGYGHYAWIERRTGISSKRWQAFATGGQKPTNEMIEAAGKTWPQFAFWLATGITDSCNGHCAPTTAVTFPERAATTNASEYFSLSLSLNNDLLDEIKYDLMEKEDRLPAISTSREENFWVPKLIASAINSMSSSKEYQRLKEVHAARNLNRIDHSKSVDLELTDDSDLDSSINYFADPSTKHQENDRIFYEPKMSEPSNSPAIFARSILNKSPFTLSEDELLELARYLTKLEDSQKLDDYLDYHQIDKELIFNNYEPATIHFASKCLNSEEIDRFLKLIQKFRHKS